MKTLLLGLSGLSLLAAAPPPQDDAAFEAALRASASPSRSAPPSRPAAPAAPTSRARGAPRAMPPPAGTLPPQWQIAPKNEDQLVEAERAGDAGLIDPLAWIERHIGKIPTLRGAQPIRCKTFGLRATYSFGIDGPPGARAAIAGMIEEERRDAAAQAAARSIGQRRRGHGLPGPWLQFHLDAARYPATAAKLREAEAMLRGAGYIRHGSGPAAFWLPANARRGNLVAQITPVASSILEAKDCMAKGMSMPTGPIFYVTPILFEPSLHTATD